MNATNQARQKAYEEGRLAELMPPRPDPGKPCGEHYWVIQFWVLRGDRWVWRTLVEIQETEANASRIAARFYFDQIYRVTWMTLNEYDNRLRVGGPRAEDT